MTFQMGTPRRILCSLGLHKKHRGLTELILNDTDEEVLMCADSCIYCCKVIRIRDHRGLDQTQHPNLHFGLAICGYCNGWVQTARLSEEAIDRIIRRK